MKFSMEKKNDVVLVQIKGSLEGGKDTFEIKDEVKARLGEGARKFVLDMSDVGFTTSTGIGVIVGIHSSIKAGEGALHICGVSERVRRSFVITGVWQLFTVFDDCQEALSFDA